MFLGLCLSWSIYPNNYGELSSLSHPFLTWGDCDLCSVLYLDWCTSFNSERVFPATPALYYGQSMFEFYEIWSPGWINFYMLRLGVRCSATPRSNSLDALLFSRSWIYFSCGLVFWSERLISSGTYYVFLRESMFCLSKLSLKCWLSCYTMREHLAFD